MSPTRSGSLAARLFLTLALVQILHSAEEILCRLYARLPQVTGFIHDRIGWWPRLTVTRDAFIAANAVFVAFIIVIAVFVFRRAGWARRTAFVIGILEVVNGSIHILAVIATGGYFPGSITAVGLITVGVLFLRTFRGASVESAAHTGR